MGVTLGPIGQIAHPVSDVDRAEAFYGNFSVCGSSIVTAT